MRRGEHDGRGVLWTATDFDLHTGGLHAGLRLALWVKDDKDTTRAVYLDHEAAVRLRDALTRWLDAT